MRVVFVSRSSLSVLAFVLGIAAVCVLVFVLFRHVKFSVAIAEASSVNARRLCEAAENGDKACVERLLAQGVDVNSKDKAGWTALHLSSGLGDRAIVELLLTKGADVNAKGRDGRTPLHMAVLSGSDEYGGNKVVSLLLAKHANVNAFDNDGETPLHMAAAIVFPKTTAVLLAYGANPNVKNVNGETPLFKVAQNRCLDALERATTLAGCLLTNKAEVNIRDKAGNTPLYVAKSQYCRHVDFVDDGLIDLLLSNNASMTINDKFFIAVQTGDLEEAKSILKGHPRLISCKDSRNWTPLHMAAEKVANQDMIALLLAAGADVNSANKGTTPLHLAAANGCKDMVGLLLTGGADVNAKDSAGWTPLRFAEQGKYVDIIDLLLQHGGYE